jgi:hypothetical protein
MPALNVGLSGGGGDAERRVVRVAAGDRTSGLTWPMNRLVRAPPTCLRCGHDGDDSRYGALFCARAGAFAGTYNTGCRARISMLCSRGRLTLCLLLLLRPEHLGDTRFQPRQPARQPAAPLGLRSWKVRRRVLPIFLGTFGPGRGEDGGGIVESAKATTTSMRSSSARDARAQ